MQPIFIAGTGRSGTTLLLRLLNDHPEVFAVTWESRFLVDGGGLMDLVDALTTEYSPSRAREALYRFEQMMRVDLTDPASRPYFGYDLTNWFGDNYWTALDEFCDALLLYEFKGLDHTVAQSESRFMELARKLDRMMQRMRGRRILANRRLARPKIREPRYFSDRCELIDLTRKYVQSLFDVPSAAAGCQAWCEKTPHNLFHLDVLLELFPNAHFIHAIRDPRDVVCSYLNQVWAPNRLDDVVSLLNGMYQAWFDRADMWRLADYQYRELRLEDLVMHTDTTLASLQSFCGFSQPFEVGDIIQPEMVGGWKLKLNKEELHHVEERLGKYIDRLGYC